MTRDGLFYELSSDADSDIEEIFNYTFEEFGIEQSSHVIFYRVLKDRIRIVRVLHGSRDLPNISF